MRREKIKSVLLVSLFLVSLTLTQRLWFYLPFGGVISIANNADLQEIDIDVTDILSPQSFFISFGGGNHTVFFSEPYEVWNISTPPEAKKEVSIWNTVKPILEDYLRDEFIYEEITLEEWEKINEFKSVRMNFAASLPGDSLINVLSGGVREISEIHDSINTILIPATDGDQRNIYFGNYEENRYHKLTGSIVSPEVRGLIANIEKNVDDRGYMYYVTLEDIFPNVNNDVLAPLFDETIIPSYSARNQIDVSDNANVTSIANQFFGSGFDFVKKITEIDGTYIYMYGYGEKALKINKKGILEYMEKNDKEKTTPELDFLDSLKYAVKFVEEKIDWPVNRENAYLSGYEEIEVEGEKGYRFSFNYRLNGLPVFVPDIGEDEGIIVDVVGKQVTYYRRVVKRYGKKLDDEKDSEKRILSIVEVLRKHSDMIKGYYIKFSEIELDQAKIDGLKTEELIDEIGLAYYSDRDDILKPVWEITVGNIVYYFDLYTGEHYTFTYR